MSREKQLEDNKEKLDVKLLTVVPSELEYQMLEELLREGGITCIKNHRGSGAYMEIYMGMTPFGIEMYVPAESLEKAKALMPEDLGEPLSESVSEEAAQEVEETLNAVASSIIEQKRSIAWWLIIATIGITFGSGVIFVLFQIGTWIF